jgi:hypothetical protein
MSPGCCSRAASGQAAAPPRSVMNSRTSLPNALVVSDERIAHLGTEETAALRDFDPVYVGCGSGASKWCRSQHFRFTPDCEPSPTATRKWMI